MAEYRSLGIPDEQWRDFPNNLPPGTRVDPMTRERLPITLESGLHIFEKDITARDGYQIRCRVYAQIDSFALPLFIYMHGGGFVTGSLETDDRYCRLLARELEIMVLSIDYRLAPEHQFPVGFEDCFDVVKWCASPDGRQELQVNLQHGFMLGGTSAGANFTAGIAYLARDEKLSPQLTGLVFLAGSFCHPDVRPKKYLDRLLSIDEIIDAPGLTRDQINYFARQYGAPLSDERYSPLLLENHANLSQKAFFSVCGWDPRRDDGLLLEKLLKEEGTETKLDVNPGLPHGFWTTCPELPVSRNWEQKLVDGLRWILNRSE